MLRIDDPVFEGNWHPMPPPDIGIYDLRKIVRFPDAVELFLNKRVYEGGNRRLLCMNRRITRMRAENGWQFRFRREKQKGVPVRYRPMAVIYNPDLTINRKEDISQQLPIAVSREEALYIVRNMPDRWPVFRQIHVEFTCEPVQS